jgi:SAM-dependent methyltransferase
VWPAALTLLEHLQRRRRSGGENDYDGEQIPEGDERGFLCLPVGASVLELGAGTGFLALKMAERRPDLRWCATEMEEEGAALRLTRNIAAGAAGAEAKASASSGTQLPPGDDGGGSLRAAALDWNAVGSSPAAAERWDVVVGSDLVYSAPGAQALSRCLASLLRSPGATTTAATKNHDDDAQEPRRPPACFIAQTCGRWGGYGWGGSGAGFDAVGSIRTKPNQSTAH